MLICSIILLTTLSACFGNDPTFDDQGVYQYGDLQVNMLGNGYTTTLGNESCFGDYGFPYVKLAFFCDENAEQKCSVDVTVSMKYKDGALWGKSFFVKEYSSRDRYKGSIIMNPGDEEEIFFHPYYFNNSRDCWAKQPFKYIKVSLRDRKEEMDDITLRIDP